MVSYGQQGLQVGAHDRFLPLGDGLDPRRELPASHPDSNRSAGASSLLVTG